MIVEQIRKCRVCGNTNLETVLDLGEMALTGVFPTADEPDPPAAPLVLVKCKGEGDNHACGLVQLLHTVSRDDMYSGNKYGYRSGINQSMRSHLSDLAHRAEVMAGLQPGDSVLDIGSNDATLLKSYAASGIKKTGIDPTGTQFKQYYTDDIRLIEDYFSADAAEALISGGCKPKVITSIAMFYDLDDPVGFARDVKRVLHPEGVWVMEQSYMPEMLRMNSFDTICHEHLEYYALKQICWILAAAGLKVLDVEFNSANGGSFRVYITHTESSRRPNEDKLSAIARSESEMGLDTSRALMKFAGRVNDISLNLRQILEKAKSDGKVTLGYGASTKGNVTLQYCGIDTRLMDAIADRNPAKLGCRTPGTNIPIISEQDAREKKPDYFLVLPWHFMSEFYSRESQFLSRGGRFIIPCPVPRISASPDD